MSNDEIAALKAEIAQLRAELAHWKVCENCGEPLTGPGICDRAITESEKGLERMHEETLQRAEKAEAERDEAREGLRIAVNFQDANVQAYRDEAARARHDVSALHAALTQLVAQWREKAARLTPDSGYATNRRAEGRLACAAELEAKIKELENNANSTKTIP